MKNDISLKTLKDQARLPSLHKSTSKHLYKVNSTSSKFYFQQKSLNRTNQPPQNITQTKAINFLNKNHTICSPSVIINVSDCVKTEQGRIFQNCNQFSQENLIKSNFIQQFNSLKQNAQARSVHLNSVTQATFQKKDTKSCFQRQEVLNLAKWIDKKLEKFNQKQHITVEDIIDYKQHILNYGLGRIIDSVKKKSREEGDLLKILWDNSFKIFEKVLEIISNSMIEKEKSFVEEENEAKNIYDMNLRFLTQSNQKVTQQLDGIYEKMQKVIIWNKRLRKQKKTLNIENRILQYRNQTYSQALEQTVAMFLKAVPEPSTINYARKIIAKLARQKRRKKKHFQKETIAKSFQIEAKTFVNSWLRRNGFNQMDQDDYNPHIHLTNQEKFELTNIDDQIKANQINIYDYFKLLDIAVQTDLTTKTSACQYDIDFTTKFSTKATLTENIYKKNFEIQVHPHNFNQLNEQALRKPSPKKLTSKLTRSGQKKKSNISKFSQKGNFKDNKQTKLYSKQNYDKTLQDQQKLSKFSKNGLKNNLKDDKNYSKKQEDCKALTNQLLDERYLEKDFTVISQKKSQEFNFDSDDQKNWNNDKYRVSISKLNGQSKLNRYEISKYERIDGKGRQASFKDFTQYGINEDQLMEKNGVSNNMKQLWKSIQNKKINDTSQNDSRLSMNFIKIDNENYSMRNLQKKLFEQVYEETKINTRSHQKQRQQLFETVVRRRSFYKKGKVTFENSSDFQQSKQTKCNLYKSYIHYKVHRSRAITEIAAEEEQKVDQINKKMAIPSNLAKSKTLAVAKQIFKQMADTCKKNKKQPPKNKQYFNNSLTSITKNIAALVQDYVRQIKRQKDDIQNDFEKTFYPLHTILMDKMNWKYGLKDISQKKIKDFLEKILTFSSVSEKVSLFSLLFGMELEGVGADQLLIYLKCLVYLEKKPPANSSIHIVKQSNFYEKVSTDHETVLENIDKILKEFFDRQGSQNAKTQILQYLQQNPKFINVEKIAEILIRALIKRKQLFRKDAMFLYKLCSKNKNIFTNFYKVLKTYNNFQGIKNQQFDEKGQVYQIQTKKEINIQVALREFIKRSDMIDEIYGKSISFERFLTAFMVVQVPKEEDFANIFGGIKRVFEEKYRELGKMKNLLIKPLGSITKYSVESVRFMEEVKKKWQGKVSEKADEDSWDWNVSKTVADHVQSHLKSVVGKLGVINNQIENFFFSLENKNEPNKQ